MLELLQWICILVNAISIMCNSLAIKHTIDRIR